jgi:hypothetical protein
MTDREAIERAHREVIELSEREFERRLEVASWLAGRLVEEMSPELMLMVGRSLAILDGPLNSIGNALWTLADGGSLWLAELRLSSALFSARFDSELLERLADAERPPWSLVAEAVRRLEDA